MKIIKVLGKIVAGLVAVLVGIHLLMPVFFSTYFKNVEKEGVMPGLMDGFIPQGMTYIEAEDTWLYSGYMADKSASRIYVVNEQETRYIELYTEDDVYTEHAGGITVGNQTLWLASSGEGDANRVYAIDLMDVLDEHATKLVMKEYFHPIAKASTCYYHNGILWIGEFEDGGSFLTDESHHLSDSNRAIIAGYDVDETKEGGVADVQFDYVLSCGQKVQGLAINSEGQIALSTSYGIVPSHLLLYEDVLSRNADAMITLDGVNAPVWMLDTNCLIADVQAPPMSEAIVFKEDRLYTIYESATLKYFFGIATRGYNIYSYAF